MAAAEFCVAAQTVHPLWDASWCFSAAPSGMAQGAQPPFSGASPALFSPMWWSPFQPVFMLHTVPGPHPPSPTGSTLESSNMHLAEVSKDDADTWEDDNDHVLLRDSESGTLFAEFNPKLHPMGMWDPPEQMGTFLEKHFNHSLSAEEREAILQDFPKLNCPAMEVPSLDDDVKTQLRSKGKDPQFGAEKTMFKIFRTNSWQLGAHSPAYGWI